MPYRFGIRVNAFLLRGVVVGERHLLVDSKTPLYPQEPTPCRRSSSGGLVAGEHRRDRRGAVGEVRRAGQGAGGDAAGGARAAGAEVVPGTLGRGGTAEGERTSGANLWLGRDAWADRQGGASVLLRLGP